MWFCVDDFSLFTSVWNIYIHLRRKCLSSNINLTNCMQINKKDHLCIGWTILVHWVSPMVFQLLFFAMSCTSCLFLFDSTEQIIQIAVDKFKCNTIALRSPIFMVFKDRSISSAPACSPLSRDFFHVLNHICKSRLRIINSLPVSTDMFGNFFIHELSVCSSNIF